MSLLYTTAHLWVPLISQTNLIGNYEKIIPINNDNTLLHNSHTYILYNNTDYNNINNNNDTYLKSKIPYVLLLCLYILSLFFLLNLWLLDSLYSLF